MKDELKLVKLVKIMDQAKEHLVKEERVRKIHDKRIKKLERIISTAKAEFDSVKLYPLARVEGVHITDEGVGAHRFYVVLKSKEWGFAAFPTVDKAMKFCTRNGFPLRTWPAKD